MQVKVQAQVQVEVQVEAQVQVQVQVREQVRVQVCVQYTRATQRDRHAGMKETIEMGGGGLRPPIPNGSMDIRGVDPFVSAF